MIDSTARAQRFEADSSPAPAFLWAPSQKPVAVSIPLHIIDQLERQAVESFRSLSSRGSEIGGLLFGTASPGSPLLVAVADYESVECDYSSGPLYRLGEAERGRLDRVIEQRLAAGIQAVGFYRSHTRKGLYLDPDDLALFDSRFTEAHHFALLIRPAATKVSIAGIFIREDGKVHAEASCLEFPFRSAQHDTNMRPDSLYDGAVAGPRSVTSPAAPAKPVIRAQIVPIASRREITAETSLPPVAQSAPEPAPPAPAAPPIVTQVVAASVPAPQAPPPPPPVVTNAAPEPKRAPETPAAPEVKRAPEPPAPAAAVSAVAFEPEPAPLSSIGAAAPRSGKMLWVTLGAAASLVLLVGFFFTSGMLHRRGTMPGAAQDASPLSLRVDRNGADIVLTWNRDSDAIKAASRAVLSISDGAQHENVEMDLAQLKNGSIVYSPVTSDVVFRMEVSGTDQTKTLSESVRVLRTRPSPMPEGAEQKSQAAASANSKPDTPVAAPAEEPAAPEEEKVALAQAVKPFKAESLAQRLHAAASADMPDAPAIGAPAATNNVNLGNLMPTQAAPAPVAATPAAAPSAAQPATQKNVGGQIQQAVLLRRKDPEYPKLARESGASGVVEVIASIGVDGRVKSVQVVRGHPLLRQAAIDAVKTWVYRPTILNGVAVETQTQVLLNFKSDR